jgi:truncated hemoglobin YjbI
MGGYSSNTLTRYNDNNQQSPKLNNKSSNTSLKKHKTSSTIKMQCPFANTAAPVNNGIIGESEATPQCPFHEHRPFAPPGIRGMIQLAKSGNTHQVSAGQAALLADIGGGDRIRELCTRFYARAFEDQILQQFFFEEDGATAHGQRLADWIIQKMGGEGEPWTESGRWGQRQPSHHKAWHNPKRHPSVRGDHFKLEDARSWIRIHFWAARELGLSDHEPFWNWYISFLEHFITVYERRAVAYVAIDAEWSENPQNIEKYIADGYIMQDIAGRR